MICGNCMRFDCDQRGGSFRCHTHVWRDDAVCGICGDRDPGGLDGFVPPTRVGHIPGIYPEREHDVTVKPFVNAIREIPLTMDEYLYRKDITFETRPLLQYENLSKGVPVDDLDTLILTLEAKPVQANRCNRCHDFKVSIHRPLCQQCVWDIALRLCRLAKKET